MSDVCIECCDLVRPLQHGITCDICDRWQHRICNTGITRIDYFKARRRLIILEFTCRACRSTEAPQDVLADNTIAESPLRDNVHFGEFSLDISMASVHNLNTTYVVAPADTSCHFEDVMAISHLSAFDVTRDDAADTSSINERSHEEAALSNTGVEDSDKVEYEVVEEGTNRKKKKLVSSDGFSYCVKRQTSLSVHWRCSVRRKELICYANVTQRGDIFTEGQARHRHPADPLMKKRVILKRDMRQEALRDVFAPAGRAVDDLMLSAFDPTDFNLPRPMTLVRIMNQTRQKDRENRHHYISREADQIPVLKGPRDIVTNPFQTFPKNISLVFEHRNQLHGGKS